ncbi:hypothetical protein OB955_04155 [Halobacteria archaeon AArc-m2/3/4]|uniref:Ig-like domain-containing protein n=1 Tax=Natronoglomus mannanivorans TaxID=2979990 RepID=A0ABT2QAG9_9EURY|nr:hypothetical protein [Halobacteria archaeon AArc-m2/3/4]
MSETDPSDVGLHVYVQTEIGDGETRDERALRTLFTDDEPLELLVEKLQRVEFRVVIPFADIEHFSVTVEDPHVEWVVEHTDPLSGESWEMEDMDRDGPPFQNNTSWDTAGTHTVTCTAFDENGKIGELSVTVTVEDSVFPPAMMDKVGDRNLLRTAVLYADRYQTALRSWNRNIESNTTLASDHPAILENSSRVAQIRLWDVVQQFLTDVGEENHFEDLGIEAEAYRDSYLQNLQEMKIYSDDDDPSLATARLDNGGLYGLLGFGSPDELDPIEYRIPSGVTPDRAMEEYERDLPSINRRRAEARPNNIYEIGPHVRREAERNVGTPSLFHRHGWDIVADRAGIENYSVKLALIVLHGIDNPNYTELDRFHDGLEWLAGYKPGARLSGESTDTFFQQLSSLPYQTQLSYLSTVLSGLSESETGLKMLASMFTWRSSGDCLDPLNIIDPPDTSEEPGGVYPVLSINPGVRDQLFDENDRLNWMSPDASSVAGDLQDILIELLAGATYYVEYSNHLDRDRRADVFATLHAQVTSLLVSDADFADALSDWDNYSALSDGPLHFRNASDDEEIRPIESAESWDVDDSIGVASNSVNLLETIFEEGKDGNGPQAAAPQNAVASLQIVFSAYSYSSALYGITSGLVDGDSVSDDDLKTIGTGFLSFVNMIGDTFLSDIDGEIVEGFSPQWFKALTHEPEYGEHFFGTVETTSDVVGKTMSVLGLVTTIQQADERHRRGETEASLVLGASAATAGVALLAEMYGIDRIQRRLQRIAPRALVPGKGQLIVAAELATIVYDILLVVFSGTDLDQLFEYSIYGSSYRDEVGIYDDDGVDLDDVAFFNPDRPVFGFSARVSDPTAPVEQADLQRQISAFQSQSTALGDKGVAAYLHRDPRDADAGVEDLYIQIEQENDRIKRDGTLFIRPIIVYGGISPEKPVYHCPVLHRIKLDEQHGDRGAPNWETQCPYVPSVLENDGTDQVVTEDFEAICTSGPEYPWWQETNQEEPDLLGQHIIRFDWSDNSKVGEHMPSEGDALLEEVKAWPSVEPQSFNEMRWTMENGVDNLLLFPDGDDRFGADRSIDRLAICMRGPPQSLLGKVDLANSSSYRLCLELLYLPREYADRVGDDVVYDIDITGSPSVSRRIVEVQEHTGIASTGAVESLLDNVGTGHEYGVNVGLWEDS